MKEHILSLSYGKDSLACLGAIEALGWPLERIVHIEIFATDTISADLPPMMQFKAQADAVIEDRWGVKVEHIMGLHTAEEVMFHRRTRGNRVGEFAGWPRIGGCEIQSRCKRSPYNRATKNAETYLGIAANEPDRIARHGKRHGVKLPLVEIGWSEADCRRWCEANGLLSPIYTTSARGGCWFCPNQSTNSLRILRKMYPQYWAMMLKWDADSPVKFKANGHTLHDYDRRFQLEDEGFLAADDRDFKWSKLEEELNYRWF